ncbi:ATP-binding protein [Lewinella sp. 4G2]|uniref:ATP-binding protein n=1 Tax=Lewinella sp. 4G2 TaxID=1803372 RepID=UPI0007B496EE|nr:ATP-binding protein [Lewinella sp. 4G2]OAV43723.1 hypothetical protein A3850_004065 [Lewinella sp. 4G2]
MESLFHNRFDEQRALQALGSRGKQDLAVVFGRRRCGKSTLIQRVLNGDGVYYLATKGSGALQRKALARQLEGKFPGFSRSNFVDWFDFFEALVERSTQTFTLCLDEFPYLVKEDESLPGLLQNLIDTKRMPFNLILCGSSQQMMSGLLTGTAPLYGRADEIMKIRPLTPGWITDHFQASSAEECITEYAVWGGVPRYWELRSIYPNLEAAVKKLLLGKIALLYDEPERILLDDIRDLPQPIAILQVVANGAHRLSEIAARLQRTAADLNRPMNRLIKLGYVKRESPFGAHPRKSKSVLYKVDDSFIRFYYRFIAPSASEIENNLPDLVWERIAKNLPQFVGPAWEDLCRRSIIRGALNGEYWLDAKRWWGNTRKLGKIEIDVVARNKSSGQLIVAECKWSHVTNEAKLREELLAKARALPFYDGEEIITVIAAKSFADEPSGLVLTPSEVLPALRY